MTTKEQFSLVVLFIRIFRAPRERERERERKKERGKSHIAAIGAAEREEERFSFLSSSSFSSFPFSSR